MIEESSFSLSTPAGKAVLASCIVVFVALVLAVVILRVRHQRMQQVSKTASSLPPPAIEAAMDGYIAIEDEFVCTMTLFTATP